MTEEIWKPVVGYEGRYEVSNLGRVRSLLNRYGNPRIQMFVGTLSRGYRTATLRGVGGDKTKYGVHVLVLEAFTSPRPDGMEACHINGVRTDNRVENLMWGTRKLNAEQRVQHGTQVRGEKQRSARLTPEDVIRIRADPRPQKVVADEYGVSGAAIWAIVSRKTWKHIPPAPDEILGRPAGKNAGVKRVYKNAKLTEKQIAEVRASTETTATLALRYKVSPSTIYGIRYGHTWRNV